MLSAIAQNIKTVLDANKAQLQGKGMGFADTYEAGDLFYVAKEDGSGNYIITRYDTSKLGTATDGGAMFTAGAGGLPVKADWAGLAYADRETTF